MIAAWLAALKLAVTIAAMPGVRPADAATFALAAVVLCPDPARCAAIAWGESRFQRAPLGGNPAVWGVMQVSSRRPRVITTWAGVAAGQRKLDEAAAYCRRRGPLCVGAVYAAGNGWRGALAQRRARAVLRRAAVIARAIQGSRTNRQITEGT